MLSALDLRYKRQPEFLYCGFPVHSDKFFTYGQLFCCRLSSLCALHDAQDPLPCSLVMTCGPEDKVIAHAQLLAVVGQPHSVYLHDGIYTNLLIRTLSGPAILSFVDSFRGDFLQSLNSNGSIFGLSFVGRFVLFQSVLYRRFHCSYMHVQVSIVQCRH